MEELFIELVFVVGLIAIAILAYVGINSETKASQKRQKDKKSDKVHSELDKLKKESKKLGLNKKKSVNALQKDVQELKAKADKIRENKSLNVGHAEKLWGIDARLSRLERKKKS